MSIVNITKENYDELVKNSGKKVVLDFWAPWCGPCRALSPVLEEVAAELSDVIIGKVNVDEQEELSREFQIRNIPTMYFVENGEVKNKVVGLKSKEEIISLV